MASNRFPFFSLGLIMVLLFWLAPFLHEYMFYDFFLKKEYMVYDECVSF